MYRRRQYAQVVYGRFNDFLKATNELNVIARKRGWPEFTTWVPTVGKGNDVILEQEYATLVSFGTSGDAFSADADAMKIWRSMASLVVQGSVHDELWEDVKKPLA
jgi:hypothetical protein